MASDRRHAKGDRPGPEQEQVHHKGDSHSGGGGHRGGGGKKRRPDEGWEKGDRRRDMDQHHSDHEIPGKPHSKNH